MTVDLYMHWRTPYNPAVAGLTVEAWEDSLFSHSPVGNPSAYPPASSPTATTTTDSSGNCELTGLTAGTNYYVSIIDENNKPWFLFCGATYLGNLSTTPRQFSIIQGPVAAAPPPAISTAFVAKLGLQVQSSFGNVAAFKTDWVQNVPPWIDTTPLQNWYGEVTTPPIKFNAGDNLMGAATNFTCPAFTSLGANPILAQIFIIICDLVGTNWAYCSADVSAAFASEAQIQTPFDTSNEVAHGGTDIVVPGSPDTAITTTAGGVYVVQFGCRITGGTLS